MKSVKINLLFALVVLAMNGMEVPAQDFRVLRTFSGGLDGSIPFASLLLSSNTLYGTTAVGGATGNGLVFSINVDGSNYKVIHNCAYHEGPSLSSVTLCGNTLYGTADQGGTNMEGIIFSTAIDSTNYSLLHTFTAMDGSTPEAGLVVISNILYGTCMQSGVNNLGTVFAMNTNGSGYTVLHQFSAFVGGSVNSDGAYPQGGNLCFLGNTLYGTTYSGGTNGSGTIFSVNTDGSGFTTLHHFGGGYDGFHPQAGLAIANGKLFGTTARGGTNGNGTLFSINTNGSVYLQLHAFGAKVGNSGLNPDGLFPMAGLTLGGDALFGTTYQGGAHQLGTIFMLNQDGSGFTTLHDFAGGADGGYPECAPVYAGNTLYGTTFSGGSNNGSGVIFSLNILPGISSFNLVETNLTINATKGLMGHSYVVLMSTNATMPIQNWTPVVTNALDASGNFNLTATNVVSHTFPQRFFILQGQ